MIITNNNQATQITQKDDKKEEKKDLKSDISSKTIFKKDVIQNTDIPLSKLDLELNKLTNKLLNALKASSEEGGYKPKVLAEVKMAQVAPNLAKDLSELSKALKSEPSLIKLANKLDEFLKPVEHIKNTNMAQTIKDTGIMLEAKIAQNLNPQTLPTSIKELLSLMKNVSNKQLENSFLNLAKDESADIAKNFEDLKNVLQNAKDKNQQIVQTSNFKGLIDAHAKLENAIKYLDKLSNLIQTKGETLNAKSIEAQIPKVLDQITQIVKNAEQVLYKINFELPNLKDIKEVKNELTKTINNIKAEIENIKSSLRKEFLTTQIDRNSKQIATQKLDITTKQATQTLQKEVTPNTQINLSNLINSLSSETSQNQAANINLSIMTKEISTDANSLNLQEKLSIAAKKLSNIMNFFDKNSVDAKNNVTEIKHLLKAALRAGNDMDKVIPFDENTSFKNLQNDIKGALLNIKEATANQQSLNNINQNVNRLITQIEMHQLISFAQNSVQTYLPYTWDGLESSTVAFKHGKKNKFYAKIDLNFIKFGSVSVVLGLFDTKYIDISILTGTDEFKNIILSSSKELKSSITNLGLIVSSFTLTNKSKFEPYNEEKAFDLGFNVKA
ncbi:hypothetical protein [Campylobacter fetus]|uniref:hypothetical protein n=1 Tax=Campylobacter fetus TaxID=196 RepID=UPI0003C275F0|nr:hypothetical protein [Campylobacter fetus]AGZ82017.1 hypothetical protein CFT03427_1158 [Campylobacter fetus subsp. testudinum 03-427]EAI4321886.1 hypothetical protein [Campylobacter fetus]EAI4390926.1 hypothetical protein [Campylobacter fetus]OCS06875.1 hypothetical protein CFTD6659_03085 [Campylobacter fetus subsp. testudinum]OCS07981.1 hypothetical protein CFTD6683_06565 [Campylobacter fetus subsp. testudinum]